MWIPTLLETARLISVTPPPKNSDTFMRKLLSDHKTATKYLPIFYKGPQGWSPKDARERRQF